MINQANLSCQKDRSGSPIELIWSGELVRTRESVNPSGLLGLIRPNTSIGFSGPIDRACQADQADNMGLLSRADRFGQVANCVIQIVQTGPPTKLVLLSGLGKPCWPIW